MKKRILSLILALSMVLSVLPLGAFAADPNQELVMQGGFPKDSNYGSNSCSGTGWSYETSTGTLYLNSGTYNFSLANPQDTTKKTPANSAVQCAIQLDGSVEITGGNFEANVTNNAGGIISDAIFNREVTNGGTIKNSIFAYSVTNSSTIENGTFQGTCSVTNKSTIKNGTFKKMCRVENWSTISGGAFACSVTNYGTINNGTFAGSVTNHGNIEDGTFEGTVENNDNGTISGGTFAGSVQNRWDISGGVFNLSAKPTGVTGGYSITWDAASSKAKIEKVNDVAANWKPYVYKDTTVTITASTEIFSLNGQPIGTGNCNSSYPDENDKTTVKFTMPGENVVLSSGELVMKDGLPDTADMTPQGGRYIGHNWGYDSSTKTLALTYGTFDFSSTHPQGKTPGTPTTEPVKCAIVIESYTTITGGIFEKEVTNKDRGTISGGTFEKTVSNHNGTISDGTFNATVTNNDSGKITDGTFNGDVTNNVGTISGGTFQNGCSVVNYGTITGNGTFEGSVTNYGDIEKGTFKGEVKNHNGTISGGKFEGTVINDVNGTISDGTFNKEVSNINGNISNGTFNKTVKNDAGGTISGGTFAAGLSANHNTVTGGVFNGNTGLTTKAHQVTVTNGSVSQVNGVDPRNADGTTGTAWDLYAYKGTTVIITADTEIFSLNGYPISGAYNSSYPYTNNKKIVKFTMPYNENVVLSTGELVMAGGYPIGSNNGANNYNGKGWAYSAGNLSDPTDTGTLHLWSGTFDFNFADPTTKITRTDSAVACEIQSYATIIGGIFAGSVKNGYTIENGTFTNKVENSGYINNGTFAGNVTNSGAVNGGVFNRNATLINVTGGHNITWDAAYSNANIVAVNDVSANWKPYAYAGTTMTITASTEIFSLNDQPIGVGNCNSSYPDENDKTIVTFTMPDKDVVLNEKINYGDLVMENGYPKASNGGKDPCKGDGWEYIKNDPTNGDMLLLTGSNQTGGLYDFSAIGDGSPVECNVFVGKPTAITGGEFNGKVFNNSGILGGTFNGEVENRAPGIIKDGTFNGAVENNGMIENGAFHKAVENNGTIENGAFNGAVENNSVINSGTFNGPVDNMASGTISDGAFNGAVENNGTIEKGTFYDEVKNNGTIENGAFNDKVENNNAIKDGTFNGEVDNTASGTIEKGTFNGAVENNGTIENGTFHDAVQNNGTINGGVFNGAVTSSGTVSESITGSGTLNGEPITKTPEPEPEPEPEPKPEPEPEPEPEPTTYTVTVIGGTIDGKTSVSAKENDTLTVVLDQSEIPDGMTFDLWSISSNKLSGDINVDYRAESMTFQMPAEDVTIRAQYRSAEIIEDAAPSPLATAATIAVGGAAAGIVVWQGVSLGVDLYLANALPQGVPVPTDRRALALLLWETAGKPEVALPTLYGDVPAEEIELQKATHWAVQNGLMDAADKKDASFFDPDHYVTKMDVFGAWLRLKKLLGTT